MLSSPDTWEPDAPLGVLDFRGSAHAEGTTGIRWSEVGMTNRRMRFALAALATSGMATGDTEKSLGLFGALAAVLPPFHPLLRSVGEGRIQRRARQM